MAQREPTLLKAGLHFPEGPRWRGDCLYFSDILAGTVHRLDLGGHLETVARVAELPSGLGWLPDGTLQVVSLHDGKLLACRDGRTPAVAELQRHSGFPCNDMVIDGAGRAWVGSPDTGFDEERLPMPGNMPRFSSIVLVAPPAPGAAWDAQRPARVVADRVTFPNGMVVTPDGSTLIAAETFAGRLTAWDIEEDGSLTRRRVWADLGVPPDGITLDREGCVWVAVPYYQYGGSGGYLRIAEGGELRDRIDAPGCSAYACTLGGADGSTLFLCESARLGLPRSPGDGRIRMVQVDVPGVGTP
jgi:sugar lactone lactonase YvrE